MSSQELKQIDTSPKPDPNPASILNPGETLRIAWHPERSPPNPDTIISFDKPQHHLVVGTVGSGKSAYLETIAECYLNQGHKVMDLWGARDGEGLAWLRSKWAQKNPEKILLLHSPTTKINFTKNNMSWDTMDTKKVQLKDIESHDMILTAPHFYSIFDLDEQYTEVGNLLMGIFMRRRHASKGQIISIICREASELLYSRVKITMDQEKAKHELIYMLKQARHCYDDQTEILTKEGWKFFENITTNDLVATRSDQGLIIYQHPTERQKYWYDGNMVYINGEKRGVNLLVTPEHSLLVHRIFHGSNTKIGKGTFVEAQNVLEYANSHTARTTPYQIVRTSKWKGKHGWGHIKYMTIPATESTPNIQNRMKAFDETLAIRSKVSRQELMQVINEKYGISPATVNEWAKNVSKFAHNSKKQGPYAGPTWVHKELRVPFEPFLKFLAFWLADGFCYGDSGVGISQSFTANMPKVEAISQVIKDMGFKPYLNPNQNAIAISSRQMCSYFRQFGRCNEKFIPSWVKDLDAVHLRTFVYWMALGDGTFSDKGRVSGYSSTSKKLADDFQEICIKAGYNASMNTKTPSPNPSSIGIQSKLIGYEISVTLQHNVGVNRDAISLVPYIGYVYDVTVPKYHRLLVRRKGRHCWSGNSRIAFQMDTLRGTSIDVEIRENAAFIVLKKTGFKGIPKDIRFLYKFLNARKLRVHHPSQFGIMDQDGFIGWGVNTMPAWHKLEEEDIDEITGIDVEWSETPHEGVNRGAFGTVGDAEHAKIIELRSTGKSVQETVEILETIYGAGRSTGTVNYQQRKHNNWILYGNGVCETCKRLNSPYSTEAFNPR